MNKNIVSVCSAALAVVIVIAGFFGIFTPSVEDVSQQAETVAVTQMITESETELQETPEETVFTSVVETSLVTESISEESSTESDNLDLKKFRSKSLLDSHYEKHGIEMGFASAEEYETAAGMVVISPAALHKTEKEDGDDVYYIEDTNEFVIVSVDGYIRTYFYPDSGRKYYDKQ